jgi:hypothetical protein
LTSLQTQLKSASSGSTPECISSRSHSSLSKIDGYPRIVLMVKMTINHWIWVYPILRHTHLKRTKYFLKIKLGKEPIGSRAGFVQSALHCLLPLGAATVKLASIKDFQQNENSIMQPVSSVIWGFLKWVYPQIIQN